MCKAPTRVQVALRPTSAAGQPVWKSAAQAEAGAAQGADAGAIGDDERRADKQADVRRPRHLLMLRIPARDRARLTRLARGAPCPARAAKSTTWLTG